MLLLKRFEFNYYIMDYVKNNCPVDVPLDIEMPKVQHTHTHICMDTHTHTHTHTKAHTFPDRD